MENTIGNEGVNKLAAALQRRMHETGARPPTMDFGTIQGDMSLLTNRFPKPIPQKDYLVCRQLTLGNTGDKIEQVVVPEKMRSIKPGDRVLVAWAGDDACVIDIILSGTAV